MSDLVKSTICRIGTVAAFFCLFACGKLVDQNWQGPLKTVSIDLRDLNLNVPGRESGRPTVIPERFSGVTQFEAHLKFFPIEDNYPNLLQTSDGANAIRVELNRPKKLRLALGGADFFTISEECSLRVWHELRISVSAADKIQVWLDGKLVLDRYEERLTRASFEYDTVAIGTGFERQREFCGEIRDANIRVVFHSDRLWWQKGILIAMCACVSALAMLLILTAIQGCANVPTPLETGAEVSALTGAAFGWIIVLAACGLWLGLNANALGKWGIIIFIPLSFLVRSDRGTSSARNGLNGGVFLCGSVIGVCCLTRLIVGLKPEAIMVMVIPCVVAFLFGQKKRRGASAACEQAKGAVYLQSIGVFLMAAALAKLSNWLRAVGFMTEAPASASLSVVIGSALACVAISQHSENVRGHSFLKVAKIFEWSAVITCFAFLALRFDSLSIPGSAMHWEYFVGPIRTLRSGGTLLWDTPSQYGFLNILIPAMLPIMSPWESFYVFQAILLILVSTCFFIVLRRHVRMRPIGAALIVIASLYFADAAFIGPSPYPSSSVVRFFWCYVLLFIAVWSEASASNGFRRFVVCGGVAWACSLFWSYEGAIYGTAIYSAPLLARALLRSAKNRDENSVGTCASLFAWPLGSLVVLSFAVCSYVRIRTGHFPDLEMYSMYGRSYAAGFGELSIDRQGPIWVFVLLLGGGCYAFRTLVTSRICDGKVLTIAASSAAIFAVCTYFVGRADSQNVVALLPILTLSAILIETPTRAFRLGALITGFVVAIVATSLMNFFPFKNGIIRYLSIRSVSPTAAPWRMTASDELRDLCFLAGVKETDRIVYYGFGASPPSIELDADPSCVPWLPVPLQLLEVPIPSLTRSRIVGRFVDAHRLEGVMIQAKGENDDRAREWEALLSSFYTNEGRFESAHYRIIRFKLKKAKQQLAGCLQVPKTRAARASV